MVFLCSAVHNLLRYEAIPGNFTYSFSVIGSSLGIFYILGLAVSILYGLIFGCMGINCKTIMIVSLYGYSLVNYTIAVLLCIINLPLLTWLFLLYAAAAKVFFILKNMFEKLDVPPAKKAVVVILVIAEAFIQLMAIKFALIVNINSTTGAPQHFMQIPSGTTATHFAGVDPLHFRTHF
jgi:hypothetical protein